MPATRSDKLCFGCPILHPNARTDWRKNSQVFRGKRNPPAPHFFTKPRVCPHSLPNRHGAAISCRLTLRNGYCVVLQELRIERVRTVAFEHAEAGCFVMSDTRSENRFLDGLNAKASSAGIELDRRYRRQLCAMVQREMGRRLRVREDPADVVQSTMRTFFRRLSAGEFRIDHAGGLWGLLKKIAHRKLLKHAEYHGVGKRDPKKETRPTADELAGREPTPSEAVALADVIEAALAGLEPPDPEVFQLRLQGCTMSEIAEQVGCKRGRVRYKLDQIGDRLRRLLEDGSDR